MARGRSVGQLRRTPARPERQRELRAIGMGPGVSAENVEVWAVKDSDLRPTGYEPAALTT